MARLARALALSLFLLLLCSAYLWPGMQPVLQGDTTRMMSDGTDGTTLPYMHGAIVDLWKNRPRELFFGAVPSRHLGAPEGLALWIPWSERFSVVALSPFVPLEHISTVFIALAMLFNALCMYALGRYLGWSRSLALAMAIAWAFSPFTRARAQVHLGFAATFHIPLALLGVMLAVHGKSWRSLLAAGLALLAAGTAPLYFVIALAFLSPFYMGLGLLAGAWGRPLPQVLVRLTVAVLPVVGFLSWSYLKPLPNSFIEAGAVAQPPTGGVPGGPVHPFLDRFAAHPVDYFTGDVAMGDVDWNPLRSMLTEKVRAGTREPNYHERANGVRWIVWLMVLAAVVIWPRGQRRLQAGLLLFGLFSFFLSLSPEVFGHAASPAYWLYSLVSQIRVPSRAGIHVHFAALLIAGLFFHHFIEKYKNHSKWRRWVALPGLLPLMMIADFPPAQQPLPLSGVRPQLTSLAIPNCGTGIYFPYVSGDYAVMEDYYFLQEMRGTNCDILNVQWPNARNEILMRSMVLSHALVNSFNREEPESYRAISTLVRCVPLSWIVFDTRTTYLARAAFCRSLGWSMTEDRVCQKSGPHRPLRRKPEECL